MSAGNNYGLLNIYKFVCYCKNVFLHMKDCDTRNYVPDFFFLIA